MTTHPIHVGEEQWRKARELADRSGTSAEDIANRALDAYYDIQSARANGQPRKETVYEALVRSGSLGCVSGGPTDLSTNPKHMEGFGENGN